MPDESSQHAVISHVPPSPNRSSYPDGDKDTTPRWKKNLEIGAFWVAVGLLLLNGGLLWVGIKSADAAQSAANTAADTLKESNDEKRPWVVVSGAVVSEPIPGHQIEVKVIFTNFGHSPALETRLIGRLFVTSETSQDVPPVGETEDEANTAIAAPNMPLALTVHTVDALNAEQIARAKKPDVRYYIYGTGSYNDTTSQHTPHHLEYCVFAKYGDSVVTPCAGKRYKNTTD